MLEKIQTFKICAVLFIKKSEKVILLILNKVPEGSFIDLGLFGVFSIGKNLRNTIPQY
jgi:hypothetical protein